MKHNSFKTKRSSQSILNPQLKLPKASQKRNQLIRHKNIQINCVRYCIEISIYSNMDNSVYTCIYRYFDMQIYSVRRMYIKTYHPPFYCLGQVVIWIFLSGYCETSANHNRQTRCPKCCAKASRKSKRQTHSF